MPRDPRAYLQRAEEHRRHGRLKEAIALSIEALGRHPGLDAVRVTLGRAYLENAQPEEARTTLLDVFGRLPEHHLAGKLLIESQRLLGDLAGAETTCRTLLEHYPRDREIEPLLAEIRRARSTTEPAGPAAPAPPPVSAAPAPRAAAAPASPAVAVRESDPEPEYFPEDIAAVPGGPAQRPAAERFVAAVPKPSVPFPLPAPAPAPLAAAPAPLEVAPAPPAAVAPAPVPFAAAAAVAIHPAIPNPPTRSVAPPAVEPAAVAPVDSAPPAPTAFVAAAPVVAPIVAPAAAPAAAPAVVPVPATPPLASAASVPAVAAASRPAPDSAAETASVHAAAPAPSPTRASEPPPGGSRDALQTNTLAELYVKQGLPDRAMDVYRSMLRVEPGNVAAQRRLAEIEAMTPATAGQKAAAPRPVRDGRPEAPRGESTPRESRSESRPANPAPASVEAPAAPRAVAAPNRAAIERLEDWLAAVRRGHDRPGGGATA